MNHIPFVSFYSVCFFHVPCFYHVCLFLLFNCIPFQSKPDYEQILKEEFEAQNIYFEANVSDCLDEGRFIFELIIYSKCGQCVYECPHLGDDKILAFRSVTLIGFEGAGIRNDNVKGFSFNDILQSASMII